MKPTLVGLLRIGFRRGSRWRVLALFSGLALIPSLVAVIPLWVQLAGKLDAYPGAAALRDGLQAPLLLELLRSLGEKGGTGAIWLGLAGGLVLTLLVGPWSAGAALAESRAAEPMQLRGLLAAAGDLWGRMVRMLLVALLPLGVAAAIAAAIAGAAEEAGERALTEAAAVAAGRQALVAGAVLLFLAHLTLDAGRAHLAAQPERRSAFLAWAAGAWMVVRRPVQTVLVGAVGAGLAFLLAFGLLAIRGRLPLWPAWSPVLGFVLATLATAAIAWGRSIRLAALAEFAAWDVADRRRRKTLAATRKGVRVAPTEPLFPAVADPAPVPEEPRPLDVTAPLEAPPKPGEE